MNIFLILLILVLWVFYRHQCLLRDRAHLMREAIRNREFTFSLPVKGLFFGEKAMQQALNDLGKDINQLVAKNEVESWQKLTRILTHEIMNAATPIQSISQAYLNMPEIKGSIYEEGIRAIHDTSIGLATFVDSYRKLTQMQEPVLTEVNLSDFVATLTPLYPDVSFTINIPSEAIITADEKLLRQVFINILKNAVEAGAKKIAIQYISLNSTSTSAKQALPHYGRRGERGLEGVLLVSNDGEIIPPEVRRDLFIPFFSTKRSGSGIGLSVSQQMLMMQGMNLSLAETPQPGFHTTFRIQTT